MKKLAIGLAALAVLAAVAAWALSAPRPLYAREDWRALEGSGDAAAGRTIFQIGGCESCHVSPGQTNPLLLGGGLELKTAFGSFFPPNISPDPKDGIGDWKVVDLANALQAGVSPGGAHLYPALPYTSYQRVTLDDIRNLMAYLRTLPPSRGERRRINWPSPFPFGADWDFGSCSISTAPALFPIRKKAPNGTSAAISSKGRAIAAECHSPRNFLGGIVASRRLTGGPAPDGKGKAPDITGVGLAKWSKADIAEALSSGMTPSGDFLGGAMTGVVRNTSQLPPAYREAIAEYLKSLAPSTGGVATK